MLLKISDNLISALGPATVGVMLGKTFYNMGDFVSTHLFRFALTGNYSKTMQGRLYRQGLMTDANTLFRDEIFPQISNGTLIADRVMQTQSLSTRMVSRTTAIHPTREASDKS